MLNERDGYLVLMELFLINMVGWKGLFFWIRKKLNFADWVKTVGAIIIPLLLAEG
ncbi:hypothetical protein D3C87_589540 [compost metagenome]